MSKQLGKVIRHWRIEREYSQKELAKEIGISARELGRIERGEVSEPTFPTINKISKVLDIPSDELWIEDEDEEGKVEEKILNITNEYGLGMPTKGLLGSTSLPMKKNMLEALSLAGEKIDELREKCAEPS